jgi:hypothetical protein
LRKRSLISVSCLLKTETSAEYKSSVFLNSFEYNGSAFDKHAAITNNSSEKKTRRIVQRRTDDSCSVPIGKGKWPRSAPARAQKLQQTPRISDCETSSSTLPAVASHEPWIGESSHTHTHSDRGDEEGIEAGSRSPGGEEQTETEAAGAEQDGPPPGHPSIGARSRSLPVHGCGGLDNEKLAPPPLSPR